MSQSKATERPKKKENRHQNGTGKPAWEIAKLFPTQGQWTENDFFALDGACELLRAELVNGYVDVLPVATELHQLILMYFLRQLDAFVAAHAPGLVLPAGLFVKIAARNIRLPDVVYIKEENYSRRANEFWSGADLAMEVVSGGHEDRKRDLKEKPVDYAAAGISEYWIIDPKKKRVSVLVLDGTTYRVHGEFGPGSHATSVLLPGFTLAVDTVLSPPGSLPVKTS
jgi:Uma2 family endonuclease